MVQKEEYLSLVLIEEEQLLVGGECPEMSRHQRLGCVDCLPDTAHGVETQHPGLERLSLVVAGMVQGGQVDLDHSDVMLQQGDHVTEMG